MILHNFDIVFHFALKNRIHPEVVSLISRVLKSMNDIEFLTT